MKFLTGNSNLPLAQSVADYLEIPLTKASVRRFADEEAQPDAHWMPPLVRCSKP